MKTISILIPTYNEEDNIKPLCKSIKEEFKKNLPNYAYEIIFIDNYSLDKTRDIIKEVCKTDKHIKFLIYCFRFIYNNK